MGIVPSRDLKYQPNTRSADRSGMVQPRRSHHTVIQPDGRLRRTTWYTPVEHPLVRHLRGRKSSVQMADLFGWPPDGASSRLHQFDHYTRRFPVEARYWTGPHAVAPCLSHTYQLPAASSSREICEPKYACGSTKAFAALGGDCVIWSIGSAGETCFEEYMHQQVPQCGIHVFDPTLSTGGWQRLQALARRGVLQMHEFGLADERTFNGTSTFRDYRIKSMSDRIRMRYCGTEQAHDPVQRKKMGCLSANMLTLAEMYKALRVSWVDYLKIDWCDARTHEQRGSGASSKHCEGWWHSNLTCVRQ